MRNEKASYPMSNVQSHKATVTQTFSLKNSILLCLFFLFSENGIFFGAKNFAHTVPKVCHIQNGCIKIL